MLMKRAFTFKGQISTTNVSGCDECIWHLIGDLKQSNKTLDQLKVAVLNISTGAAANDKLKYYNYTTHRFKVLSLFLSQQYRVCLTWTLCLIRLIVELY